MNYTVVQTMAGWLALAGDERGLAILTLPVRTREKAETTLFREWDRILSRLAKAGDSGSRLVWQADYLGHLQDKLSRYFLGEQVPLAADINWGVFTPFQREVLSLVQAIPYGEVRTYGEIARALGKPGGARAVGGALRSNSIPLVIPCHRVIQGDGSLGGFNGQEDNDQKRFLLKLEGWLKG